MNGKRMMHYRILIAITVAGLSHTVATAAVKYTPEQIEAGILEQNHGIIISNERVCKRDPTKWAEKQSTKPDPVYSNSVYRDLSEVDWSKVGHNQSKLALEITVGRESCYIPQAWMGSGARDESERWLDIDLINKKARVSINFARLTATDKSGDIFFNQIRELSLRYLGPAAPECGKTCRRLLLDDYAKRDLPNILNSRIEKLNRYPEVGSLAEQLANFEAVSGHNIQLLSAGHKIEIDRSDARILVDQGSYIRVGLEEAGNLFAGIQSIQRYIVDVLEKINWSVLSQKDFTSIQIVNNCWSISRLGLKTKYEIGGERVLRICDGMSFDQTAKSMLGQMDVGSAAQVVEARIQEFKTHLSQSGITALCEKGLQRTQCLRALGTLVGINTYGMWRRVVISQSSFIGLDNLSRHKQYDELADPKLTHLYIPYRASRARIERYLNKH